MRVSPNNSPWTTERFERAKELRNRGWSSGMIAQDLGAGVTRNAVIGKLQRENIKLDVLLVHRPYNQTPGSSNPRPPRQWKPRPDRILRKLATQPSPEGPFAPLKVAFRDLSPHHCRWPMEETDDDGLRFSCGLPIECGSYCSHHIRIAYIPR